MNAPRHYVPVCDAELGDQRCGVNLPALVASGVVLEIYEPQTLRVAAALPFPRSPSLYDAGSLLWISGDNAGTTMTVRACSPFAVELVAPPQFAVQQGDRFQVTPVCDRRHAVSPSSVVTGDCSVKFDNVVRFRGFPAVVPPAKLQ